MAVAKSYKDLPRLCEPYEVKGRMYVNVQTPKGETKTVRWYTDYEYRKMYGEEPAKKIDTPKTALGFINDYITIFKNNSYDNLEYFRASEAKYNKIFGWYFASDKKIPNDLPSEVIPIQLFWNDVSDNDELKSEAELKLIIEKLIFDPSKSEFVGEIGDKIEKVLTVTKTIPFNSYYGTSIMHIFIDEEDNEYVWSTSSKALTVGETYQIKGTIKNNKFYRNSKQTILTRCKIL